MESSEDLPPVVSPDREAALETLCAIFAGIDAGQEVEGLVDRFVRLTPDPQASNLIFWPQHHPLSAQLDPVELTPERIVELAFQYRAIAL